jgi:heat shock protein HslJ
METRPALIALLLVICVLSAGCMSFLPTRSPKGPAELTSPSWRLVSYSVGERTLAPVSPGTNITLKFGDQGKVSGFLNGCRNYSGHYTTLGETIKVTNLTEVDEGACPLTPDAVEMKNTYFALLQKSPRFNVNEGTLVFGYYDSDRYLVFSKI